MRQYFHPDFAFTESRLFTSEMPLDGQTVACEFLEEYMLSSIGQTSV